MLKKILITLTIIFSLICCWQLNSVPVFGKYANKFEVYQGKSGSLCEISTTDRFGYSLKFFKTGESCVINCDIKPARILKDFDARIVKIEKIEQGVSIYAYSSKLRHSVIIDGKTVNLQIFCGKEQIKVGTPLIYGSF